MVNQHSLVNLQSGTCHLFMEGGELEDFPVNASEDPFPLALLGKILASDGERRTSLVNLPGANLTTIFDKPLNKSQLEDRLQASLSWLACMQQTRYHYNTLNFNRKRKHTGK